MPKHSNFYTFKFATIICSICSFLLAFVSQSLLKRQEVNIEVDIKKNILKAVRLENPLPDKPTVKDVLRVYQSKIIEKVIRKDGSILEGKKPSDFDFQTNKEVLPLYIYEEDKKIKGYCYPISGKGLWSTLYGYFAIEPDAKTVRGISFYKHGETPGLGGEIEKSWFQNNFIGKSFWDYKKKQIRSVAVVKGKVSDLYPSQEDASHYVDGISGATITSRGVTNLLAKAITLYESYFKKIRKKSKKGAFK